MQRSMPLVWRERAFAERDRLRAVNASLVKAMEELIISVKAEDEIDAPDSLFQEIIDRNDNTGLIRVHAAKQILAIRRACEGGRAALALAKGGAT